MKTAQVNEKSLYIYKYVFFFFFNFFCRKAQERIFPSCSWETKQTNRWRDKFSMRQVKDLPRSVEMCISSVCKKYKKDVISFGFTCFRRASWLSLNAAHVQDAT